MSQSIALAGIVEYSNDASQQAAQGTVAFKFKTTTANANAGVLAKADGTQSRGGYTFYVTPTNLVVSPKSAGGTGINGASPAVTVNDGNWHAACWVYDTANAATHTLTVDGTGSTVSNNAAWSINPNVIRLGRVLDLFWANIAVEFAYFALWSRKLNTAEVAALMAGASPGRLKPTSWFPMVTRPPDLMHSLTVSVSPSNPAITPQPRQFGR